MKTKLLVLFLIFIVVLMTSCTTSQQTSASVNDNKMTLNEFNSLSTNMSYEDAVKIVGGEGVVISEVDMSGYKTTMYQWEGKGDAGANANVTFQNGKLISKAQYGLK